MGQWGVAEVPVRMLTGSKRKLPSDERNDSLQGQENTVSDSATVELDDRSLKRMILNLEKQITKNQELRLRFDGAAEKYVSYLTTTSFANIDIVQVYGVWTWSER